MGNRDVKREISIFGLVFIIALVWVAIYQNLLVSRVNNMEGDIFRYLALVIPLTTLYVSLITFVVMRVSTYFKKNISLLPLNLNLKLSSVLVFTLIVSSMISLIELEHRQVESKNTATVLANDKINRFQSIIRNAEVTTGSLALLLKSRDGKFSDFDDVARIMLQTSPGITNLQLAKNGIISNIYPLAGNEAAIGHDLLSDPERNKEAIEAVVDQKTTLAGPFNLIQGGKAVIARNLVIIDDEFWGFASALLLLDPLLELSSIPSLADLGYDWSLSRLHPDTGNINQFAGTINTNDQSSIQIEITVPNATWRLEIKPKLSWISSTIIWTHSGFMVLFISVFFYFIYLHLIQPFFLQQLIKKRNRQLIDQKMLLNQSQEISNTGSWKIDFKREQFSASKEFYNIYHIPPAASGNTPYFYEAIHPSDVVKISNIQGKLLAGQMHTVEYRLVVNGELRWVKETAVLQLDRQNNPIGIIGACQDISEQKLIEQTLKTSEERIELALSGAELGSWDVNLLTGDAIYNERWFQILGYEPGELNPSIEQFEGLLHPDDLKLSRQTMIKHFHGAISKYSADLRIKGKSGEWVWIQSVGKVVERDVNGQPVRACGTHRDITTQKLNEQRLRLLSVAIENNPVATMMTSPDAIIEYVNPEFERMTGFSERELKGQNSSLLASGKTDVSTYQELWRCLKSKQPWTGELWNRKKSGELVLEAIQITPVLNDENEIISYVSSYQDITEQRQLEKTVWKQVNCDYITGLANRGYFEELVKIAMQRAKRQESYAAFIYIDLDGFYLINDKYGHEGGNLILKEFGQRLEKCIRATDIAGRVGGDAFALVIEGLASINLIDNVIQGIRTHTLGAPFTINTREGHSVEIELQASFGLAIYPNDALTFDALLLAADKAMYEQKKKK